MLNAGFCGTMQLRQKLYGKQKLKQMLNGNARQHLSGIASVNRLALSFHALDPFLFHILRS